MKRSISSSFLLALFLLATGCAHREAIQLPQAAPPVPAEAPKFSKQVLAFYYGWYGRDPNGSWIHWSQVDEAAKHIGSSAHFPELGAYDSHDPRLAEQHCRWAKSAGITGFIVSWWRPGDFHDQGMPLLLDTAQRFGLSITIYLEQIRPTAAPTPQGAIDDVLYVLGRYGRHPAWLTVGSRPVVFVYGRAVGQLPLPQWTSVIEQVNSQYAGGAVFVGDRINPDAARVFDGIHTYNPTGQTKGKSPEEVRTWARAAFSRWIETAGPDRIACVTLIPGYDDRTQGRPPPRPLTDRQDGETYRALWEEALLANPDWVLICSWNEWHEGSEIEPSAENGDRELRTTAEFAPKFLTLPLRVKTTGL